LREEDQIGCAWIAARLAKAGYVAEDERTTQVVERWRHASPSDCLISRSVDYLKRTGQTEDLQFILDRINDLDETYVFDSGEIVIAPELEPAVYNIA
jgi:2-phosphosulfolactate phosphatase